MQDVIITPEDESDPLSTEIKLAIAKTRMYEKPFPLVDELVMTRVEKITDIGVIVHLVEYGQIEGVVLLSDIVKRRMRSVTQHLRPGQMVSLQVLRVDPEKGYIDLSKKVVSLEDEKECQIWYNKSKTVHSILGHVIHSDAARKGDLTLETLYTKIGWLLYNEQEHALDAFEAIANGDMSTLDRLCKEQDVSDEIKNALVEKIKHRLGVKPVRIQADIQVTCFTPAGIGGIKPALKAAENIGKENSVDVKVHLVRSPEYILFMSCKEAEKGIGLLNNAIEACKTEIQKHGGDCVVKTPPRVVC
eukprot:TRINITY_DN6465_c0_g7_i1.p1 TRINITY_DN6465_c0_g7~~TRINITY_DN6465_c0_g7_i1.p1  ORF type:complete len:345 (+),score=48.55 TRINITY_DN6465_c0_g7_i1:129-1037(+)